jgi:hypothetical protein
MFLPMLVSSPCLQAIGSQEFEPYPSHSDTLCPSPVIHPLPWFSNSSRPFHPHLSIFFSLCTAFLLVFNSSSQKHRLHGHLKNRCLASTVSKYCALLPYHTFLVNLQTSVKPALPSQCSHLGGWGLEELMTQTDICVILKSRSPTIHYVCDETFLCFPGHHSVCINDLKN